MTLIIRNLGLALAMLPLIHLHKTHVTNHWFLCRLKLDRTETRVTERQCWRIPMPKAHGHPVGWWIKRTKIGPRLVKSVRYPIFHRPMTDRRVQGPSVPQAGREVADGYFPVTGYSYGCGASGPTRDGSAPGVGDVASDNPLYWHRTVYVPSLGYRGFVNDTGVGTGGFDLFTSSCSSAYAVTGWRRVIVY